MNQYLQKSPIIKGSFAKRDLQLKASYASSPPYTHQTHVHLYTYVHMYTYVHTHTYVHAPSPQTNIHTQYLSTYTKYARTYVYMHTHTYTYTYTVTQNAPERCPPREQSFMTNLTGGDLAYFTDVLGNGVCVCLYECVCVYICTHHSGALRENNHSRLL